MKIVCLILTIICASHGVQANGDLEKSRAIALGLHVKYRLNQRLQAAASCGFWHSFKNEILQIGKPDTREKVVSLLDLYRRSKIVRDQNCLSKMNQAEQDIYDQERAGFFKMRLAMAQASLLFAELDPHCLSSGESSFLKNEGFNEYNICIAGDELASSLVRKNNDPIQSELNDFLNALSDEIKNKILENIQLKQEALTTKGIAQKQEQVLDLWNIFLEEKKDSRELRLKFLAFLTVLHTIPYSNSIYLLGAERYYWQKALEETSSPELAYLEFNELKAKVDRLTTLKEWAHDQGVSLELLGQKLSIMNRHNIMAGFLGCYYSGSPLLRRLPAVLGLAYESFDFKAHWMDEKWPLKHAIQNFRTDTHRYRQGSAWGAEFCGM